MSYRLRPRRAPFRPRVEELEARRLLATAAEVEPNNLPSTANPLLLPIADVTQAAPDTWLAVSGAVGSSLDVDYYRFTLTRSAGVFLDVDSRETFLSTTLDSVLTVYNGIGLIQGNNDDGYDFETGYPAPFGLAGSTPGGRPTAHDSALYLDLGPGTYTVRVRGYGSTTGAYELRLLADTTYSSAPPAVSSDTRASKTLYLDFDGHTSTGDAWNGGRPYAVGAFDLDGRPGTFTPAERLAVKNVWRVVSEDYAPFAVNVTTVAPASFADNTAFRQVIADSNGSEVGEGPGVYGVAYTNSFRVGGARDNLGFTFVRNFLATGNSGRFGETSVSGQIMAVPVELGNTSAHEIGHALGLLHYGGGNAQPGGLRTTGQNLSEPG